MDEESRFPKATDQSLAIKLHQTLSPLYSDVYIAPKNVGTSFHILHYAGQVLYNVEGFLDKNRDFLPNNLFYAARSKHLRVLPKNLFSICLNFCNFKDSNNFLVQELFQCKLTRKGTIAPSDRQSRLRKSMHNTFNNNDNNNLNHMSPFFKNKAQNTSNSHMSDNNLEPNTLNMNKVKFNGIYNNSYSSSTSSSASNIGMNNNSSIIKEEFRNSVNSHYNNQYSSEKALPLTVACHFKVIKFFIFKNKIHFFNFF